MILTDVLVGILVTSFNVIIRLKCCRSIRNIAVCNRIRIQHNICINIQYIIQRVTITLLARPADHFHPEILSLLANDSKMNDNISLQLSRNFSSIWRFIHIVVGSITYREQTSRHKALFAIIGAVQSSRSILNKILLFSVSCRSHFNCH